MNKNEDNDCVEFHPITIFAMGVAAMGLIISISSVFCG